MKKIMGLAISATLLIALVVGGTWAYFSDTSTSTDNLFTVGTLDLQLSNDGSTFTENVTASFSGSDLAPGSVVGPATITLKNKGSIDGDHVDVKFEIVYDNVSDYTHLSPDNVDISTATWLVVTTLTYDSNDLLPAIRSALSLDASDPVTLEDLNNYVIEDLAGITAGSTKAFVIKVEIPTATGNGIQGDEVDVTVTFGLFQDASQNLS